MWQSVYAQEDTQQNEKVGTQQNHQYPRPQNPVASHPQNPPPKYPTPAQHPPTQQCFNQYENNHDYDTDSGALATTVNLFSSAASAVISSGGTAAKEIANQGRKAAFQLAVAAAPPPNQPPRKMDQTVTNQPLSHIIPESSMLNAQCVNMQSASSYADNVRIDATQNTAEAFSQPAPKQDSSYVDDVHRNVMQNTIEVFSQPAPQQGSSYVNRGAAQNTVEGFSQHQEESSNVHENAAKKTAEAFSQPATQREVTILKSQTVNLNPITVTSAEPQNIDFSRYEQDKNLQINTFNPMGFSTPSTIIGNPKPLSNSNFSFVPVARLSDIPHTENFQSTPQLREVENKNQIARNQLEKSINPKLQFGVKSTLIPPAIPRNKKFALPTPARRSPYTLSARPSLRVPSPRASPRPIKRWGGFKTPPSSGNLNLNDLPRSRSSTPLSSNCASNSGTPQSTRMIYPRVEKQPGLQKEQKNKIESRQDRETENFTYAAKNNVSEQKEGSEGSGNEKESALASEKIMNSDSRQTLKKLVESASKGTKDSFNVKDNHLEPTKTDASRSQKGNQATSEVVNNQLPEWTQQLKHHAAISSSNEKNVALHTDKKGGTKGITAAVEVPSKTLENIASQGVKSSASGADMDSTVKEKTAAAAAAELPEGWTEHIDETSGRVYFYNAISGETSWERPVVNPTEPSLVEEPEPQVDSAGTRGIAGEGISGMDPISDGSFSANMDQVMDDGVDVDRIDDKEGTVAITTSTEAGEEPSRGATSVLDPDHAVESEKEIVEDIAESSKLPDGWSQHLDEASGRTYYYNMVTGDTSWEVPLAQPSSDGLPETETAEVSEPEKEDEITHEVADDMLREEAANKLKVGAAALNNQTKENTLLQEDDTAAVGGPNEAPENVVLQSAESVASGADMDSTVKEKTAAAAAAAAAVAAELPEGWTEHTDETSGRIYYYNGMTGKTAWEFPINTLTDLSGDGATLFQVDDRSELKSQVAEIHLFGINTLINKEESKNCSVEESPIMKENDDAVDAVEGMNEEGPTTHERSQNVTSSTTVREETGELINGWSEHKDENSGRTYYYNMETRETSWKRPSEFSNSIDACERSPVASLGSQGMKVKVKVDDLPGDIIESKNSMTVLNESVNRKIPEGWVKLKDDSTGRYYFLNKTTNETTWDIAVMATGSAEKEGKAIAEKAAVSKKTKELNRLRPCSTFATFGFGGRLCFHRSDCKGVMEIHDVSSFAPTHPVVLAEMKKQDHGIFGSLNGASNDKVASYIQKNVDESSPDNFWNLIQIASNSEGRLRSDEGVADTSSPESAILKLYLQNDLDRKGSQYKDVPIKVEDNVCESNALDRIESLLLHGKREEAVQQAVHCNQFALALLVASMCDKNTFQDVTKHFAEQILQSGSPLHTMALLFSGQLEPPPDDESDGSSMFPSVWTDSTDQIRSSWKHHLCAIISNRTLGWDRIVLSLGDRLLDLGDVHAAHCCYMVCGCPLTSILNSSSRMTLLGCDQLVPMDIAMMTEEGIASFARSEAYEWAKRKGNPDAVIQSLQAFKLAYAMLLADLGFRETAADYVKSIRSCCTNFRSSSITVDGEYPSVWALSENDLFLSFLNDFENRLAYEKNPIAMYDVYDILYTGQDEIYPLEASERSHYTSGPPIKSITANAADGEDISFLSNKTNLFENQNDSMQPAVSTRTSFDVGQQSRPSGEYKNIITKNGSSNIIETDQPTSITEGEAIFQEPREMFMLNKSGISQAFNPVSNNIPQVGINKMTNDLNLNNNVTNSDEGKAPEPIDNSKNENRQQQFLSLSDSQMTNNRIPTKVSKTKKEKEEIQERTTPLPTPGKEVENKVRNNPLPAPHSAPAQLQKTQDKKAPSSGQRNSLLGGFKNRMIKLLNPNAKTADLGGNMEAYFDKEKKVWVFPGEDPAEKAKPIGPPPKISTTEQPKPKEQDTTKLDPLAAMMAPPPRTVSSIRRTGVASLKPPGNFSGVMPGMMPGMMPPGVDISSTVADTKKPPTFMVFTAKEDGAKKNGNKEKVNT